MNRRPIIYLNEEDERQAETLLKKHGVEEGEPYVVIACETEAGTKKIDFRMWGGAGHFPDLVERIRQKHKIKIVVLLPESSETEIPGAIRIRGEPTIRAGAAIIKRCALFIGVDCGLTHVASAFDVKIISIHQGYPVSLYGCLSPHATIISNEPFLFFEDNRPWERRPISVDRVMEQVDLCLGERDH